MVPDNGDCSGRTRPARAYGDDVEAYVEFLPGGAIGKTRALARLISERAPSRLASVV